MSKAQHPWIGRTIAEVKVLVERLHGELKVYPMAKAPKRFPANRTGELVVCVVESEGKVTRVDV